MHNLPVLVKGKPRCTLHVHPDDAARYGLADEQLFDALSGNAVLNGIPVSLAPA